MTNYHECAPHFSSQRPIASKPIVGDVGRSQRVLATGSHLPTMGKGLRGPTH